MKISSLSAHASDVKTKVVLDRQQPGSNIIGDIHCDHLINLKIRTHVLQRCFINALIVGIVKQGNPTIGNFDRQCNILGALGTHKNWNLTAQRVCDRF